MTTVDISDVPRIVWFSFPGMSQEATPWPLGVRYGHASSGGSFESQFTLASYPFCLALTITETRDRA